MSEKKLYAVRVKGTTNRFFKWVELCEDGYGEYQAQNFTPDFDNLPTFVEAIVEYSRYVNPSQYAKDYTKDELELVEFTLSWK